MVSQRGQAVWSSTKLLLSVLLFYIATVWNIRGAQVPTVWTFTFHAKSTLHSWGILSFELHYLDSTLYELQRAFNKLHENATVVWMVFAVILWRNAIAAWRDWELFFRGRVRTNLETARDNPRVAQPLPTASTVAMSAERPPALRQWSQSLHEDIFKGLEFTE